MDMNTISTTYPYVNEDAGVARNQCTECGGWERSDKGSIRHSKRCESRAQAPAAAQVAAPVVQAGSDADLRSFARNVRRTGLTNGRDHDVLDAVRAGYLSESDAMNADD